METTDKTDDQPVANLPSVVDQPTAANALMQKLTYATWMESAKFEHVWRIAKMFAASDVVPDHYKRKVENCFIGVQTAFRLDVDPFVYLQKSYIVHGKPGIEAQLAIALANARGPFRGRIMYRMSGDGDTRQCVAFAVLADTGEEVSEAVSVRQAKDMGWWSKKDSLWPKATDLMLKYRSAMWLVRTVCPEVLMGLYSYEELIDMSPENPDEPHAIIEQLDADDGFHAVAACSDSADGTGAVCSAEASGNPATEEPALAPWDKPESMSTPGDGKLFETQASATEAGE